MPHDPASPVSVADLGGLWIRELYVAPDGARDATSQVWWLQAGALCGDMRAPIPDAHAGTAFAGRLEQQGDVFGWRFAQSWGYPPDAPPDEGRLRWEGGRLREDGVHAAYVEIWRRASAEIRRAGRFAGGLLIEIGPLGFCARAGRFVLAERDGPGWVVRAAANPAANAATAAGDPIAWPEITDGEIRFDDGPLGAAGAQRFDAASVETAPLPARNRDPQTARSGR